MLPSSCYLSNDTLMVASEQLLQSIDLRTAAVTSFEISVNIPCILSNNLMADLNGGTINIYHLTNQTSRYMQSIQQPEDIHQCGDGLYVSSNGVLCLESNERLVFDLNQIIISHVTQGISLDYILSSFALVNGELIDKDYMVLSAVSNQLVELSLKQVLDILHKKLAQELSQAAYSMIVVILQSIAANITTTDLEILVSTVRDIFTFDAFYRVRLLQDIQRRLLDIMLQAFHADSMQNAKIVRDMLRYLTDLCVSEIEKQYHSISSVVDDNSGKIELIMCTDELLSDDNIFTHTLVGCLALIRQQCSSVDVQELPVHPWAALLTSQYFSNQITFQKGMTCFEPIADIVEQETAEQWVEVYSRGQTCANIPGRFFSDLLTIMSNSDMLSQTRYQLLFFLIFCQVESTVQERYLPQALEVMDACKFQHQIVELMVRYGTALQLSEYALSKGLFFSAICITTTSCQDLNVLQRELGGVLDRAGLDHLSYAQLEQHLGREWVQQVLGLLVARFADAMEQFKAAFLCQRGFVYHAVRYAVLHDVSTSAVVQHMHLSGPELLAMWSE
ncbi:hypothetical protein SS50377_21243 [Spironucleus salmonicida]|uniref:Uncharacterized protein n=1 Tax=Spironucleus salmonicida TaxID=348837 RepID=V6LJW6_9EUKA|nr:hypothetical protein SS50377_21243 [Spironucleus salmonicida]|eukprot:EST44016.1 Hypothetical protein SS50377_16325 [Spironucleus salmonicida]